MAFVLGAKSEALNQTSSPETISRDYSATAVLVVLKITYQDATNRAGGTPTMEGTAMFGGNVASHNDLTIESWYLQNDDITTGTGKTITIPNTGATALDLHLSYYTGSGSKHINISGSFGTGSSPNGGLGLTTGQMGVNCIRAETADTPSANTQTLLDKGNSNSDAYGTQYGLYTGATVWFGWTITSSDYIYRTRIFEEIIPDETLIPNDTTHKQTADNVALTQANTVVVSDTTHKHTTENVIIVEDSASNDLPVITLNTADLKIIPTTLPILEFTGADGDGDDITYQIQVDDSIGFGSTIIDAVSDTDAGFLNTVSPEVLIDEYDFSQGYAVQKMDLSTETAVGQSLEGTGIGLSEITFKAYKGGSPSGNTYVEIYAHTGTFGSTGVPTGSALATSEVVAASSFTTDNNDTVTWVFATPYTLTNGTKYCVVVRYLGGDASNWVGVMLDGSSPTHGGNTVYNNAGGWQYLSTWDTVFNAINGDADPFTQGNKISYTAQSALSFGTTYYWRVRGADLVVAEEWGSWSEIREFRISDNKFNDILMNNIVKINTLTSVGKVNSINVVL